MLQKTTLLEYLLAGAEELSREAGRNGSSSNYFLAALLFVFSQSKENKLPSDLNESTAKAEIAEAEKYMSVYGAMDYMAVSMRLYSETSSTDYNYSLDEFTFSKFSYTADSRARLLGKSKVDTLVYLDLAFEEPSSLMKSLFVKKGAPAGASSSSNSGLDFLAQHLGGNSRPAPTPSADPKDEAFDLGGATAPKGSAPTPEAPSGKKSPFDSPTFGQNKKPQEPSGELSVSKLAETVRETRNIQKLLLDKIYGQDQAVSTFVSGYFQSELETYMKEGKKKPATFLFAGPPGTGKTFLAETAAEALGRPFKRFDMSEYSEKEANLEFCGSDNVYKNSKEGNVTGFVAKNPRCVLLFDEIEKAHINVIYLFLQLLDAGRLRDNFTDEEVSFSDAVVIFTTNVGKNLYENTNVMNLSSLPRKQILKALSTDADPATGVKLFPAAICSRFASGNVVMFNHLGASNLHNISKREIDTAAKGFESSTGIKIELDEKVATAILLSEGGKADARTVKGRSAAFFHDELYELFRLLASECDDDFTEKLKTIKVGVSLDSASEEVRSMFVNDRKPEVLVFAEDGVIKTKKKSGVVYHVTDNIEQAKDILFNYDISLILCDVNCKAEKTNKKVLNVEDVISVGRDFLSYALSRYSLPVYLLEAKCGMITQEEYLSFASMGVRDVISADSEANAFEKVVLEKSNIAYQQNTMNKLARENRLVSYKSSQSISSDGAVAEINLFDFKLALSTDVEDSKHILDNVSKPNIRFPDVIGAEDAKAELTYFVEFLKSPQKYMRMGVKAPKGVLLYGPPGTGKTLLAKAMACESDVTFITAEGNQFIKKYIGEGPEAVHALFNTARKYAPSILFIDEIDAIGKDRNASGSHDSVGDVLTAFLTEMDGFNTDTSSPVFVLAATNYAVEEGSGKKTLDPALLRRFDRRIYVDLPNKSERKRFLEMKMAKHPTVKLSQEQVENIAVRSTGMSLALLDSVFELALRNAIRSQGVVDDATFEEAFETFNSGEKKSWSPEILERTARHEAGHALLCWLGGEKPSYLTVVARGDHGGYMQHADNEGKALYTKAELLARIRTSLAGRAAEIVYYGREDGVSTGASGDLFSATRLAESMICNYGMDGETGLSYIDNQQIPIEVRARVNKLLEEELENAIKVVTENKKAIDEMVKALIEKNHLKEREIDAIFTKTVKA